MECCCLDPMFYLKPMLLLVATWDHLGSEPNFSAIVHSNKNSTRGCSLKSPCSWIFYVLTKLFHLFQVYKLTRILRIWAIVIILVSQETCRLESQKININTHCSYIKHAWVSACVGIIWFPLQMFILEASCMMYQQNRHEMWRSIRQLS